MASVQAAKWTAAVRVTPLDILSFQAVFVATNIVSRTISFCDHDVI